MKGAIFLLAFFCFASYVSAQPAGFRFNNPNTPTLLKNINTYGPDANPDGFIQWDSQTIFYAATGAAGRELWVWREGAGSSLWLDIAPGRADGLGYPSNIVLLPNTIAGQRYFVFPAWSNDNGWELWRSNGTIIGTELLRDIYPGNRSSNPSDFTYTNNRVVFTAEDPINGIEVWQTNGVTAAIASDINNIEATGQAPTSSYPADYTVVNTTAGAFSGLYFTAYTAENGRELYYSRAVDGSGAVLVDINQGAGSSYPYSLTPINGRLYFTAFTPASGWEAYYAVGATATLIDVWPGAGSSYPNYYVRTPNPSSLADNTVFFTASTPAWGNELWRSDGTVAGTRLSWDIFAGPQGSDPINLVSVPNHGVIYFTATPSDGVTKLYYLNGRTTEPFFNGTLEIANAVQDSVLGTDAVLDGSMVINWRDNSSGSEFYFGSRTSQSGYEVFVIRQPATRATVPTVEIVSGDGTFGGINQGIRDAFYARSDVKLGFSPVRLTANSFAFGAFDRVLGRTAYVISSSDPNFGPEAENLGAIDQTGRDGSSYPSYFDFGVNTQRNKAEFDATFNAIGYYGDEVYFTTGKLPRQNLKGKTLNSQYFISKPTRLISSSNDEQDGKTQGSDSEGAVFASLGGEQYFFFSGFTNELGRELCYVSSDGLAAAGQRECVDILPGAGGSVADNLFFYPRGEQLFFSAYTVATGIELFYVSSSFPYTFSFELFDLVPGNGSSYPENFYAYTDFVIFTATNPSWGRELWRTDGTVGGTSLLLDINPGPGDSSPDNFYTLTTLAQGSIVFFTAYQPGTGYELWAYDGVTPKLAADVFIGVGDSNPASFANVDGYLYFAATHATFGREVFVTSTTTLTSRYANVFDLEVGPADSNPDWLVEFKRSLYFSATTRNNGTELYWTRGAVGRLPFHLDINNGPVSSSPAELTVAGDKLYFSALHNSLGRELWATYPSAASSRSPRGLAKLELVFNGNNASAADDGSSDPQNLFAIRRGLLVFSAYDAATGREPYTITRPSL